MSENDSTFARAETQIPPAVPLSTSRSFLDLTGKTFGRWTVLHYTGRERRRSWWACKCECGNCSVVDSAKLTSGWSRSCGCLQKDVVANRCTTHGQSRRKFRSPEYKVWSGMLSRCDNQNATGFKDYGGRGIRVCERWMNSFENFYADMGPRPTAQHEIDRIDVNGNYEPSNCKWVTKKQNARNTRKSRFIEIGGETLCIGEWAERTGVSADSIRGRINNGWQPIDAITVPVIRRRPRTTNEGSESCHSS